MDSHWGRIFAGAALSTLLGVLAASGNRSILAVRKRALRRARLTDRESHGVIREIVSKRTTCRIKRLFSEKEKQADFGSKDCARNLAKRAHRQNYAVLNRHQHRDLPTGRYAFNPVNFTL